jgi:hypothetical protein
MSLKDLFSNPNLKSVTSASLQDVIDDTESLGYVESYLDQQDKFRTNLDFSSAENFVRFGSAEKYYVNSIERIYKSYPYDGSRKEKVDFFLSSSDLDVFIFENEYPRTNGYANFIRAASTSGEQGNDYYPPTSNEYILVKGGPNTSQRAKDREITNTSGDYKDGYANKYDFSKNRENNLKIGGTDGNTVEFWLKKDAFVENQDYLEFVVDAHVTGTNYGDENYGRLQVALATTGTTGNSSNKAIHVHYASGSSRISTYLGSSTLTTGTIADGNWHHYAVRMKTVGSNTVLDLFVDGEHNDTTSTATTINYVSGNIVATVGALAASIGGHGARGWAPLSGSLDEFRYWKVSRDSQQIGRQYIEPIGAGSNTDDANTHLGVYFKFNEGITQTASIDATVLDYSGRISNGSWTGYNSSYSRETGSAFVESGKAPFEFKDPILYSFHPDVATLLSTKRSEGQEYDYRNPNSMYKSIPSWITDQEFGKENPTLENLTQILSSYFDTLHAQIENLSSLKHISYVSGTDKDNQKPYFFNNRILQSYGFPYIPDLFKDASFIEYFRNRDDKILYEEKLYNVKNTIYNNIYNNLSYINKSKGTEKAFRNFFRCFGLDDEVLKLRYYSNNGEFEYTDNVKSINEIKKYVNFTLTGSSEATIYQYKTNDNATSFIAGSDNVSSGIEAAGHGFSVECQAIFPIIPSQAEQNNLIINKNYTEGKLTNAFIIDKETSIYGLRTAGTTENDTTVPTLDRAGFVVKSIRDEEYTQRCKFKLSPTENSYFPEIETPYFEDVFDESKWNFSVVIKPTNYGQSNFVSGSEDIDSYDVVFMGTRVILGSTLDDFEITSTISNTFGKTILTKPKRVFIGAERENVSGSLTTRAFSNVSDCRFWLKPLSMSELKKHNTDIYNYGVEDPYDSAYLFQDNLSDVRVSNIETLALHWNFLNLTSSNASGQFEVDDFSSGSSDDDRYGDLSGILSRQHSGRGEYFIESFSDTFARKNVYNTKTDLPGYINSSDMINITNFDDMKFTRETRPISYFMAIEKSMYQTVSEDMIKIFSTMRDYGSTVGKQYSKYRIENKDLKHLRQLFFENISNTPKLEKYVDYYKWFDTGLNTLVTNLIPITALRDDDDPVIKPVVEEYVFNREKYLSKFPTLELKASDPEGSLRAINELLYPWKEGHRPLVEDEAQNCLWFKERVERTLLTSGDAGVDADRQEILNVINNLNNATPPNLKGPNGSYQGSTYALRKFARPLNLTVKKQEEIHGGGNASQNKRVGVWDAIRRRPSPSPTDEGGLISIEPPDSKLESFKDCNDNLELNKGKRKYKFSVFAEIDGNDPGSSNVFKGDHVFPFSLYSSSVTGNPAYADLVDFQPNLAITNLHHDNYGPFNDVPMQGPFTEKYVGGRAYRHVMTNFTPDNEQPEGEGERLEGWRLTGTAEMIDLVNVSPHNPKSVYFREEYAKRPVNIKNIQQTTGAAEIDATTSFAQGTDAAGVTKIGNFTNNYEVIMTNGRSTNNRFLVKSEGELPTATPDSTAVSGVIDSAIARRDLTGSGKSVIVNRFSAPGDFSTMAEGMLDAAAGEFSVYNSLNYRNLPVREALQELLADHANQFGYFSDEFEFAKFEAAKRFGVTYPGGRSFVNPEDYSGTGSFHKINRNGRQCIVFSGSTGYVDDSYLQDVKYDNYHVQHQIPQTDVQYSWITSSLIEQYTGSALYGFERPDFSNTSFASTDITFVSASDSGSTNIKVDFVGLNTLVLNNVSSELNLLSSSEYYNDKIESLDDVLTTNAILLNRGGPAGGSNWKLYKKDSHPIVRAHKAENRLSFVLSLGGLDAATSVIESPVVSKYDPVRFDVFIEDPRQGGKQNVIFQQSYINNFAKFSTKIPGESELDLNNGGLFFDVEGYKPVKLSYNTLKDLVNGEVADDVNPISSIKTLKTMETFWPKQKYTYLSDHRQREQYENLFWRDDAETRRVLGSPPESEFFVKETPQYSLPAKDLFRFGNNLGRGTGFSGSILAQYFQPENSGTFSASIWPLDSRKNFETNSPGRIKTGSDDNLIIHGIAATNFSFRPRISSSDGSGILQNAVVPFSSYLYAEHSNPSSTPFFIGSQPTDAFLLPQYNRRIQGTISEDTTYEYKIGDTKWEAGEQSGLSPFYNTYDEYCEDIKRIGKDYSLIPEFRISDHMDFYLENAGDFLLKPPGNFEVTGAVVSSTLNPDFEKVYLHSDFLNTFNIVNSDFDTLENTKITLTADALIKFLPYDGFYPADRTVQLAKLFHQSYESSFAVTGAVRPQGVGSDSIIPGETLGPRQKGFMNPVFKSLFAPGILYNSIKSGLAVDYPVHTASIEFTGAANQRNHLGYLMNIPRINSDFEYRVPFEALADPMGALGGIGVIDNEPHPSASINLTASLAGGGGKLNYTLAMNNFLASTIDFFKEDGNLTTLASVADTDSQFGVGSSRDKSGKQFAAFIPGTEYTMRIVCYNGIFDTFAAFNQYFANSTTDAILKASYNRSVPTVVNYARTGSDTLPRSDYYGSSFGPPVSSVGTLCVDGIDAVDNNYSSASYEPFTPPYYDGYSHIELTYKCTKFGETIPEIVSQLTQSFVRLNTSVVDVGKAGNDNEMNLDSSLNYLQIASRPTVKSAPDGTTLEIDEANKGNVLVIQPKWECPILDFSNVPVTLPNIGSGSVARGMWHQYGSIPGDGQGVFLQIQDLDPSEITPGGLTGSLADKLGFKKNPVRIGEIANRKKISEAIVAIPFKKIHPGTGEKQFYKINRNTINAAIGQIKGEPVSITSQLTPSEEILDMVTKMQKFVIPPHLDFVTNRQISPFAMFIFDFEVTLNQQDLANIWQNLSPNIGRKAIKSNASLPARLFTRDDTLGTALMPVFDKDTRWMVFKVKQKSAYNYFAKTADSKDDDRFKFNFEFGSRNAEKGSVPDYSYNWPFDFFSLIELGKVSAQHQFNKPVVDEQGNIILDPQALLNKDILRLPKVSSDKPTRGPDNRGGDIARDIDRTVVDPSRLPNFGLISPRRQILDPANARSLNRIGPQTQRVMTNQIRTTTNNQTRSIANNVRIPTVTVQTVAPAVNTVSTIAASTVNTAINPAALNIGASIRTGMGGGGYGGSR